jgi:uncharacterized protein (DUF736 family)
MAIIGTFRKTENGYEGIINTFAVQAEVSFEPVARKSSEKAPDFRIFTKKTRFELGAAWHTSSAETGAEYESVKLDDPSLAAPIQCRLVKSNSGDGFSLLWDRRKRS